MDSMTVRFSPVQKESLSRLFDCDFVNIPPSALLDLTTAEWAMRLRTARKGLDEREMMLVAVVGGHIKLPDDVLPEVPKVESYEPILTPEQIEERSAPKRQKRQPEAVAV